MAGQNVTFDFLTRGADKLASDFRKTGDNAALAARGAKVLADTIEKLGKKEDRTAAESKILASALRQTGEAADRTTARIVLADAAVRRLDDAMKDASKKPLEPQVTTAKALKALAGIQARAEELRAKFPQFTAQINDKVAKAKLDLFAAEASRALGDLDVKVKVDETALARAKKALASLHGPGLLGPAVALAPAAGVLGGVAAGAAAGLGGAFIAGAGALAAFGAVAKPVLSDALKAEQKVETAAGAHAAAVEKVTAKYQYAMSVAKTQAQRNAAYAAEQKGFSNAQIAQTTAQSKAYAGMSDAQIRLSQQLGAMSDAWNKVKAAETPVIAGALQPWLKSVTDLTKNLPPIIAKIAPVIQSLGGQFDNLVNSSAFRGFRDFIGSTGAAAVSAGGSTIIDLVKSFMILLPKFDPLIRDAVGWIARLGPAVLAWSSSKKASDDITKFMQWFSQNGPVVGDLLKNIGGALKAMAPGLTSGGVAELNVISGFLGLVAKLPPAVAKPLAEVAGAALILSKLGVLKVGVQFIGAAAKWLTGGVINLGGGAAAGAEIQTAMVTGGRLAGAEIAAAMRGGGAAAGGGGLAGAAGSGAVAGKAAGGGFIAAFRAAISPVLGGVLVGALIRAAGDTLSPAGSFAGKLNAQFQADGHMWSTSLLHSFTFGGLEGWMTAHFGQPVGGFLNKTTGFLTGSWGKFTGFLSGSWNQTWAAITGRSAQGSKSVGDSLAAAGRSADALRTRNLVPLQGEFGKVTGGIQGLAGTIQGTMLNALRAAGSRSDAIRTQNLVPLRGEVGKVTGGIQGLQGAINAMHGKTVNVGVHASGSGGMTFTQKVAASISSGGFSLRSLAGGGMITQGTGPTADDVVIRASRGELIVPANMVKAGAVDHLRGRIPGFAGGGVAGMVPFAANAEYGFGRAVESALLRAEFANLKKAVAAAAKAKAAAAAQPFGPLGDSGARSGSAALAQAFARSIMGQYHWGPEQWPPWLYLGNQESGWSAYAVNRSSGAYGIGQSLGHGHPYNLGDYKTQVIWMANYIRGRYGTPAAAWAHERAFNWYAKGGLVPGYASGGQVSGQGAAWLKAWQTRHGGGFGAAWGPKVLNQQIPEMAAAVRRAKALAGASGLSPGQHRFWAATAADETRRLGVLHKELATERAWRTQLGINELGLDRQIRAAGNLPSLAGPARGWKAQLGRDKARVAAISRMLGYSDAYIKAHPAPKPGPVLPTVTHSYGGDVANNLGTVLAAALGPFTGAARGGLVMDQGGTLRPGFNPVWNMTGRPESLIPARGGGDVHLHLTVNGPVGSQQQLEDWYVKTANKLAQHGRLSQAVKAASR